MSSDTRSKVKKARKLKDARESDTIKVENPKPTNIVIPIMGPTGVGKSTFINTAVGRDVTLVGEDLESCTEAIQPVVIPHPYDKNRRVIFVDTPGFDDTFSDDAEILRRIAVWLALSYNEGMKIGGIIYLHEISNPRMLGTSRKNFVMFNKLCGDHAIGSVILATTKWGFIKKVVGERREQQLSETHWKEMLDQGSRMKQFELTKDSAWAIVNLILQKDEQNDGIDSLQIQEELVDLQKRIPSTKAGISLRNTLQELLKEQKDMAHRLKHDLGADEDSWRTYEEVQKRIHTTLDQIKALKIPLGARIMAVFFH